MRIVIRQPAAAGEVYGPAAFAGQFGRRLSVRVGDSGWVREVGTAELVEAEVVEGGAAVLLTLDIDQEWSA